MKRSTGLEEVSCGDPVVETVGSGGWTSGRNAHQELVSVAATCATKHVNRPIRQADLLATKAKLRDQALETMSGKNTGSKTRARLARLFGMGIVAPSGDDLGSLDPRGPTPKARGAAAKAPGKAPRGGQDPATVDTAARMPASPKEKPTAKASKPLPRTTLRQLPEPEDD